MFKWPKQASRSIVDFSTSRSRVTAIFTALIFCFGTEIAFGQTASPNLVSFPNSQVEFVIGPQLRAGSPENPHVWFDDVQLGRGLTHGSAFPSVPPMALSGTASVETGSAIVYGVGTRFLSEMDPGGPAPFFNGRLRIRDGVTYRQVQVLSVQSDTQLTLTAPWSYSSQNAVPADTNYHDGTTWNSDVYVLANYYDLGLGLYTLYYRTGNPTYLAYARKVADSWWKSAHIKEGTVRTFDTYSYTPRNSSLGGLILRALDGRPEMWDWINAYTRYQFNNWLKTRTNDPQLYIGVRDGGFMLLYATWLAKTLPDSFPLQAGGIETNGAVLRAQYLVDVETVSTNYFGRLQYPDGSWRWDDNYFTDDDGGQLRGVTQPFMVGLVLHALVDVHRLTTDPTIKSNVQLQITKACQYLFNAGPYRKDEAVNGLPGKRWRSFWYFYHGGTTVNPTKYENGGGSYVAAEQNWIVKSERQGISTIFSAYGYAYVITGDPAFKAMGDELFESAFGNLTDAIHNQADDSAKNYNQNYRSGSRYLAWRLGGETTPSPTPTPAPSPTPAPTPTPTPTPTATPSPTPLPSPSPSPTPNSQAGRKVKNAKARGQNVSNDLASTGGGTSSVDNSSALQANLTTTDALALLIVEIQEAQTLFNLERVIFPAALRIEVELNAALQRALQANQSFLQGDLTGARTNLRVAITHLELSDVLITYGNIANPIDAPSYIVRQHYIDFLDREPEQAGSEFWINQLSACGTDALCLEDRRINVSAAFFLSIEFQQTGYFVHRLYKSSYRRVPTRAEFMPDNAVMGNGIIVGTDGWEARLAANKDQFLQNWVQRAGFVSRYASLSNRQYVDALIFNIGVTISPAERNALVQDLSNGVSRASVLGRLADNAVFSANEFNSAFVLMQYFGYLRRDFDNAGFTFWLNKLNEFGGDYQSADMVKAFLASQEYRRRFAL